MAITTNGIGTLTELGNKGVGWFNGASGHPSPGVTSSQCPIQSIIQNNLYGKIINNTYTNTQIVRYNDVIPDKFPVTISCTGYVTCSLAVYFYYGPTGFLNGSNYPTGDCEQVGGISGGTYGSYDSNRSLFKTNLDRANLYGIVVQNTHAEGSNRYFDIDLKIHSRSIGTSGTPGSINNTIQDYVYNIPVPYITTIGPSSQWGYVVNKFQPLPANIELHFTTYEGGGGTGSGGSGPT